MIVIQVRGVMTRRLVTIAPETSCDEARRLMDEQRFRHLSVVTGGGLIGTVSDRDVQSAVGRSPRTAAASNTLLRGMRRLSRRVRRATLCIGAGQGIAMVVEREP